MVSPVNGTAALTILQGISQSISNTENGGGNTLSVLYGGSDTGSNAARTALATINKILSETGGEQAIVAGDGSTVKGTDLNDYIVGGNGSTVYGGAGDDYVVVGHSSTVYGGAGNDTIYTGGNSTVYGEDGDDVIYSGNGSIVEGGAGDDKIEFMGSGMVDGGAGNDSILAAADIGHTEAVGGDGDDKIIAQGDSTANGTITANGGNGNDRIVVTGNAVAYGDDGDDHIISYFGGSTIEGGKGDDTIGVSKAGASGKDTLIKYNSGDGKDTINLTASHATLELGDDFTPDNVSITYSDDGSQAIIRFAGNEDDQITVNTGIYGDRTEAGLTLSFADGTQQELAFTPKVLW